MRSLDYEKMVRESLRGVVRMALEVTAQGGLPGESYFYIGFDTTAPGVVMPDALRARFPSEMTIVLQHQFWDLAVGEEMFSVGLSFGGVREHLSVPFAALTSFVDPSVPFGLRFREEDEADEADEVDEAADERPAAPAGQKEEEDGGEAQVLSLEDFRRS